MNLKMNLLSIILIFSICPALMAKPCSVEDKSTPLGDRFTRFIGPTGKKVDLLFSQHLDPSLQADLQRQLDAKFKDSSVVKTIQELSKKIRATHRDILAQKRRELQLLDAITATERIRWLGVELPNKDVKASQRHLVMERIQLEKTLTDAGLGLRDTDDIVLLLHDSVQYWLASAPDRITAFRWIGVEDATEHSKSLKSAEAIGNLQGALKEYDRQITSLNPDSLKALQAEVESILGEKRALPRDAEKQIVQRFPSSEARTMASAQIQAARDLVITARRRDFLIAEKVIQENTADGILTIGQAHREGLIESLTQLCQKKIKP